MAAQSDVTTVPIASRTYNVPGDVVGAVTAAASSGAYRSDHWDIDLARRIIIDRRLTVDDVVVIASASSEDGGFDLRGGSSGLEWADRVLSGIQRDLDREYGKATERWGYNPDEFDYLGLASDGDEDTITGIVRKPGGEHSLDHAELLTGDGWRGVEFDLLDEDRGVQGVSLDRDLFAFSAKALIDDGVDGVVLSYADPITFLQDVPVLASALVPGLPGSGGHVYAIVDSTDTSAVMDVIMITPPIEDRNAQIFRRNAGKWQLSTELYDTFMSSTPPPIVELVGDTMSQVLSQVDANSSNQLMADENGIAEVGDEQALSSVNTTPIKTKAGATKSMFPPGGPTGGGPFGHKVNRKERSDPNHAQPGKAKPPENRGFRTPEDSEEGPGTRPPMTASIIAERDTSISEARSRRDDIIRASRDYYATDEGFGTGFSLIAAIQDAEVDYSRAVFEARRDALLACAGEAVRLQTREIEIENFIMPVVAASKSTNKPHVHTKPGQVKAEALRRYWTTGKGGVLKIRWNTPGDHGRCTRQLRKYLGSRAEAYCALRHREQTGMWTGDKKHRNRGF